MKPFFFLNHGARRKGISKSHMMPSTGDGAEEITSGLEDSREIR